jgi:hypothetical protein
VVLQTGPTVRSNARQNFDNTLFADMQFPDSEQGCYFEKVEQDDVNTIQFKSSWATNTLRVYNAANTLVATYEAIKKTTNMNKQESMAALFASAGGGKIQVFFENGLPIFAEEGMDITITDQVLLNGTYEIEEIVAGIDGAEGYEVLIITAPAISGVISGTATFEYDAEPYEAFEVTLQYAAFAVGKYHFIVTGEDVQFANYTAQSEPFESKAAWKNCILLDYKDFDNSYDIFYDTGIQHRLRFEGVFKWPEGGGERTVYKDSKVRTIKLEEYNTRHPLLMAKYCPPYLLEKIKLALAHDYILIDEVEHQCEEDFEFQWQEGEALHHGSVKVVQVDFQNENSNDEGDSGDVDFTGLDINDELLAIDP